MQTGCSTGKVSGEDLGNGFECSHSVFTLKGLFLNTRVWSENDFNPVRSKVSGMNGVSAAQFWMTFPSNK